MRRISVFVCLVCLLGLVVGCGSEAPHPGDIHVSSEPDGAMISLDGHNTGLTTPATLEDLEGGTYTIQVTKEGFTFRPDTKEAEVPYGGETSLFFETGTGSIQVTSTFDGAVIFLDGNDTGLTTPATIAELDPGTYSVSVAFDHHWAEPSARSVEVVKNQVAMATFELSLTTVVLFEGFSNVECSGCVDMAASVEYLLHDGGYGPDRFLYIKFSGPFPNGVDPFYRSNLNMNVDRASYYFGTEYVSLPKIATMGALPGGSGELISTEAMIEIIDAGNTTPVDFYLTTAAPNEGDLDIRDVECSIDIVAPHVAVDLSEYELHAVIVYTMVTTEEEYDYGGSEYHWVARDHAIVADSIGSIAAGGTAAYDVTLSDPDPEARELTPEGRCVMVFVQHASNKSIIQAGSSLLDFHTPTPGSLAIPSGGSR